MSEWYKHRKLEAVGTYSTGRYKEIGGKTYEVYRVKVAPASKKREKITADIKEEQEEKPESKSELERQELELLGELLKLTEAKEAREAEKEAKPEESVVEENDEQQSDLSQTESANAPDEDVNNEEKRHHNLLAKIGNMLKTDKAKTLRAVIAGVIIVTSLFGNQMTAGAFDEGERAQYANSFTFSAESVKPPSSNENLIPSEILGDALTLQKEAEAESPASIQGIKDGYGEKGMFFSEDKTGPYAFANAAEVAEVCNNDPKEMIKYAASNQVESFADYFANLPEDLKPEGFKGLGIIDTDDKLEGLSSEEYQNALEHFCQNIDKANVRNKVVSGTFANAYMAFLNSDGDTHENMGLFKCNTTEHDLEVTELYWLDENGNELPDTVMFKMTPVRDEQNNITGYKGCMQVISRIAKVTYNTSTKEQKVTHKTEITYSKMFTVPNNVVEQTPGGSEIIIEVDGGGPTADTPVYKKKETPPAIITGGGPTDSSSTSLKVGSHPRKTTTTEKEWGKSGDPHGGENVTQSDLVNPASEISKEENEKINKGSQGYIDDNKATPVSSSESNGVDENSGFAKSGVKARGATTSETRLKGDTNQAVAGESSMAGQNAYRDDLKIEQGRKKDASGNESQAKAQSSITSGKSSSNSSSESTNAGSNTGNTVSAAGRDNNSNAAEERAVREGNF